MSALTYAAAHLLKVLPRARVSRAVGRLAERRWSPPVGRAVVAAYSRYYDVRLDECEPRQGGYPNFDAFFTRSLRAGVRPVAQGARVIVSPADGRIESMERIDDARALTIKGKPYRLGELLGDEREARRYAGGSAAVVYLSPRDYHRVHAPVEGVIPRVSSLAGDHYPVNSIGMRHVPRLFSRNRRVAIAIETAPELGLGRVTVVMVGAMIVGRITVAGLDAPDAPFGVHAFEPPRRVARGEEIGVFHLGSTAIVLLEKDAGGRWLAEPGPIRYGQPLATAGGSLEAGRRVNGAKATFGGARG
jgi:phosphatidylserine decarboxylase